jgi:hypothetical protein
MGEKWGKGFLILSGARDHRKEMWMGIILEKGVMDPRI